MHKACALLICALSNLLLAGATRAPKADSPNSRHKAAALPAMTLRDKAAQLIVMPVIGEPMNVRSRTFKRYEHLVRDLHIGGVIVMGRSQHGTIRASEPYALAALLNRLQNLSPIPLLVGADFERGASMRVSDTTAWPYNMAFAAARDLDDVRYEGAATAREARALGVNWLFAPVSDVNNNPDNPIINIRSYSEDPVEVARYVKAYIEGAHSLSKAPVLVTVKHFPGHGDTAEDSHLQLARLNADRNRIDTVELVPFRAAIDAGVDSIMTAHLAVPALEPQEIPATVSSNILTGLLRNELKFRGLVVTDAMDMQGLAQMFDTAEASVRAIQAGADVLLMPRNAEEAIDGLVRAVRSGRLSEKRLDESVARVLAAKAKLNLRRNRTVDTRSIAEVVGAPEDEERAQTVANRAVTLVKDTKDLVPLRSPESTCLIALTENRYGREGWHLLEEAQKRLPKIQATMLDPKMSLADMDDAVTRLGSCSQIVVAAYVTVAAYRGNVALAGDYPELVNKLIAGSAPVILASLGNPYLFRNFPDVAAYLTTMSSTTTSESALVTALFGETAITGKLPVTIPGLAKYGDGIQINAAKLTATR